MMKLYLQHDMFAHHSFAARAKKRARSSSIEDKSDDEDDIESIDYGNVILII